MEKKGVRDREGRRGGKELYRCRREGRGGFFLVPVLGRVRRGRSIHHLRQIGRQEFMRGDAGEEEDVRESRRRVGETRVRKRESDAGYF